MPSRKPGSPVKASKVVLPRAEPLSQKRDRLLTVRVSDYDLKIFKIVSKEMDLNMTSMVRMLVHREEARIALNKKTRGAA